MGRVSAAAPYEKLTWVGYVVGIRVCNECTTLVGMDLVILSQSKRFRSRGMAGWPRALSSATSCSFGCFRWIETQILDPKTSETSNLLNSQSSLLTSS